MAEARLIAVAGVGRRAWVWVLAGWLLAGGGMGGAGGCAALGGGREPALLRFEATRLMMGTAVRVVLYAPTEAAANEAAEAAFARGGLLEARFTDYKRDSELSLLSETAGSGTAVRVSSDLYNMLSIANHWSYVTDGAFDATVGSVVKHWRRARRTGELPPADAIRTALASVGYVNVQLDPSRRTARLAAPGTQLDLGGIAKGYIADEMLATLAARGVESALIDAGGNIVVSAAPPGRKGWVVALLPLPSDEGGGGGQRSAAVASHPDAQVSPAPRYVTLTHAAVSTSGDAFQHVVIDGVRYSHIVDPATGIGLTTPIAASVIVFDQPGRRSGAASDALSTAICVMGPKRGLAIIERLPGAGIAAIVMQNTGDTVVIHRSASFDALHVTDEPAMKQEGESLSP